MNMIFEKGELLVVEVVLVVVFHIYPLATNNFITAQGCIFY